MQRMGPAVRNGQHPGGQGLRDHQPAIGANPAEIVRLPQEPSRAGIFQGQDIDELWHVGFPFPRISKI